MGACLSPQLACGVAMLSVIAVWSMGFTGLCHSTGKATPEELQWLGTLLASSL